MLGEDDTLPPFIIFLTVRIGELIFEVLPESVVYRSVDSTRTHFRVSFLMVLVQRLACNLACSFSTEDISLAQC